MRRVTKGTDTSFFQSLTKNFLKVLRFLDQIVLQQILRDSCKLIGGQRVNLNINHFSKDKRLISHR